jgi:NlpC/P60 family putative phage cell wall peptidase
MTGHDVVAEARLWLGTPYRHQAHVRGIGSDCIGLIGGVALELGLPSGRAWANDPEVKGYGKTPDPDMLLSACERHLVPIDDAALGDIYLMAWEDRPRHFAILSQPGYVIHAYALLRRVVETPITGEWREGVTWQSLIVSAWRYREVVGSADLVGVA